MGQIIVQGFIDGKLITQGYVSSVADLFPPIPSPTLNPANPNPFPIIVYTTSDAHIYRQRFVTGTTTPILHNGRAVILAGRSRVQFVNHFLCDEDLAAYDLRMQDRLKNYTYYIR